MVVVTPEILTLSKSVCPSTSRSPLASILFSKVDIPATLSSAAKSVDSAVAIPTKVDIPDTFKFLVVTSSPIDAPPVILTPPTYSS